MVGGFKGDIQMKFFYLLEISRRLCLLSKIR